MYGSCECRTLPDSHVQLVGSPLTVVYEEGTSIGPDLASAYAAITKVTLGRDTLVVAAVYHVTIAANRHW